MEKNISENCFVSYATCEKCLAHQTGSQFPLIVYFQHDSRHKTVYFYEVNNENL